MPRVENHFEKSQFDDVVRRATGTVQPDPASHRLAIAMFWGVALSLTLWGVFLAIVL
jgi:hypothetical protein